MPDELHAALRDLHARQTADLREKWQRSLPFGDLIVDRWERARLLGFGEGSSIYDSAVVIGDVRVGAHSWIGPFTLLDGSGELEIGSYCSISAGVQIYTHDTVLRDISGHRSPVDYSSVVIGSRCYIGPQSVIARGVRIGDGAVIGACSLVLHDVPAGMKAFGTPARVVGPASEQRDLTSLGV